MKQTTKTMHQRATHAPSRNLVLQWVGGVILLFCGCAIYLLFRSPSIHLFQWVAAAGCSDFLNSLRQSVQDWQIPVFVKFSLPDGLYCASYILLMDAAWKGGKTSKRLAVSFIPIVAIIHEMLQGIGMARGTFSLMDLLCYVVPLFVYFVVIKPQFTNN